MSARKVLGWAALAVAFSPVIGGLIAVLVVAASGDVDAIGTVVVIGAALVGVSLLEGA